MGEDDRDVIDKLLLKKTPIENIAKKLGYNEKLIQAYATSKNAEKEPTIDDIDPDDRDIIDKLLSKKTPVVKIAKKLGYSEKLIQVYVTSKDTEQKLIEEPNIDDIDEDDRDVIDKLLLKKTPIGNIAKKLVYN